MRLAGVQKWMRTRTPHPPSCRLRGVNLKREKNCVINTIQTDYAAGYYQTIHT